MRKLIYKVLIRNKETFDTIRPVTKVINNKGSLSYASCYDILF